MGLGTEYTLLLRPKQEGESFAVLKYLTLGTKISNSHGAEYTLLLRRNREGES